MRRLGVLERHNRVGPLLDELGRDGGLAARRLAKATGLPIHGRLPDHGADPAQEAVPRPVDRAGLRHPFAT
jgi:hypothetical protein